MNPRANRAWRTVAIALACLALLLIINRGISGARSLSAATESVTLATSGRTLVVHIFADTDPEYLKNLNFFVKWGIPPDDDADYVIVVQNIKSNRVIHSCTATFWLDNA